VIVELTPLAETDLAEAALAYELERAGLGVRFAAEVDRALESIGMRPLTFAIVAEEGVRRALVGVFPYAAFFLVFGDHVRVFAILHQHRRPSTWITRKRS
jgi:plasmid stabilization system protein ParE